MAAVLAGCAPTSSDPTADITATALAERACAALHALPATQRQRCCGDAQPSLAPVCIAALASSLQRGAVRLQPVEIEACASEVESSMPACDTLAPQLPALPMSCAGMVDGRIDFKDACRSSLECGDGLYCRGAGGDRVGTCVPPAPIGAACQASTDELAALLRQHEDARHPTCAGVCLRGRCLARAGAGEACASSALCGDGLHCIEAICQARPPPGAGEACSAATSCRAGLVCQDRRCSEPKRAGAACTFPFECRSLACLKDAGTERGICADACAVRPSSPLGLR